MEFSALHSAAKLHRELVSANSLLPFLVSIKPIGFIFISLLLVVLNQEPEKIFHFPSYFGRSFELCYLALHSCRYSATALK